MSKGLQNYPNTTSTSSDYPNRDIKDDTGADDGTPVNHTVYADIHQTLAKLLRLVNLTPNGLHDNEYTGFQYVQAMFELFGRNKRLLIKDGAPQTDLVESDYHTNVIMRETAQTGHVISIALPTGVNTGKVFAYNYSPHSLTITTQGGENINSTAPPYILPTQTAVELTYSSGGGGNWVVTNRYVLDN